MRRWCCSPSCRARAPRPALGVFAVVRCVWCYEAGADQAWEAALNVVAALPSAVPAANANVDLAGRPVAEMRSVRWSVQCRHKLVQLGVVQLSKSFANVPDAVEFEKQKQILVDANAAIEFKKAELLVDCGREKNQVHTL